MINKAEESRQKHKQKMLNERWIQVWIKAYMAKFGGGVA